MLKIFQIIFAIVVGCAVLFIAIPPVHGAAKTGQIQTLTYQTTYQSRTYRKQALVYLPADYSSQQSWNVLYLLHGSTMQPRDFFTDGHLQKVLDDLTASGKLKQTIVVLPTYYPDRGFVKTDYTKDRPLNRYFAKHELVHDLMPAVAQRYNTYAQENNWQASRKHRAFAGFSMGAITTWYVFQYDLADFGYFLPIAGDAWNVAIDGGSSASQKTAKLLSQSATRYPDFFIGAGVGSSDGTQYSMTPQINAMREYDIFGQQHLQYHRVDGGHDLRTVNRELRYFAPQLFK